MRDCLLQRIPSPFFSFFSKAIGEGRFFPGLYGHKRKRLNLNKTFLLFQVLIWKKGGVIFYLGGTDIMKYLKTLIIEDVIRTKTAIRITNPRQFFERHTVKGRERIDIINVRRIEIIGILA